jgi:long-chain acyl-CoA synthetase
MNLSSNLGKLYVRQGDSEQIALLGIDADGRETGCTFGMLDAQADAVAALVRSRGIAIGERVAILGLNSVQYVAALLGIMRAGCVAVPVNFKFPPALVGHVLSDSGARLVFGDAAGLAQLSASGHAHLDAIQFDSLTFTSHALNHQSFDTVAPGSDDVALILYTSGSTGKQKGVLLTHSGHEWVVRTRVTDGMAKDEKLLIAAPLYHMNALALTLLGVAAHVTTVLLPQFNAAAYIQAIAQHRCTFLTSVPPMIAMMLRETELLASVDLTSVRSIRMGSAPVSESLLARIKQIFPHARVINAYGTTEGGPVVFGPHPDGLPTPLLSVGHARPDVAVRLVDSDGQPGNYGVLELKSPALMRGYHQRPDLALPFTTDGYYRTGDMFKRDEDGFFSFIGRHDDMFVSGGENIFPSEVERMLEQHPGIQQACVVPIDDEIKGKKPVAFVIPRANHGNEVRLDPESVKQFALANAPAYQYPRHVWVLSALPLASTNKIDRTALINDARRRIAVPNITLPANQSSVESSDGCMEKSV